MCIHIPNAQVSIRTFCCRKWYDCSECHDANEEHDIAKRMEMIFACKKCRKTFRKNMEFDGLILENMTSVTNIVHIVIISTCWMLLNRISTPKSNI